MTTVRDMSLLDIVQTAKRVGNVGQDNTNSVIGSVSKETFDRDVAY